MAGSSMAVETQTLELAATKHSRTYSEIHTRSLHEEMNIIKFSSVDEKDSEVFGRVKKVMDDAFMVGGRPGEEGKNVRDALLDVYLNAGAAEVRSGALATLVKIATEEKYAGISADVVASLAKVLNDGNVDELKKAVASIAQGKKEDWYTRDGLGSQFQAAAGGASSKTVRAVNDAVYENIGRQRFLALTNE
jgi:hypothetical protein